MRYTTFLVLFAVIAGQKPAFSTQHVRSYGGKASVHDENQPLETTTIRNATITAISGGDDSSFRTTRRLASPLQLPVFLSAQLDDGFLSQLTSTIGDDLMPEMLDLLNSKYANINHCGVKEIDWWPDLHYCVQMSVNFQSVGDVQFTVQPSWDSKSFIAVARVENIEAIPLVRLDFGGLCSIDNLRTVGSAILSSITMEMRVGVTDSGTTLYVGAENVTFGPLEQWDIEATYDSFCSVWNFPTTTYIDAKVMDLFNDNRDEMAAAALDGLKTSLQSASTTIPSTTIRVSEAGNVTIVPAISKLNKGLRKGLLTESHVSFHAELVSPEWRRGYKYQPSIHSTGSLPQPNMFHVANFNMRASGINALIDSLWYITWASIATSQEGVFTSLPCFSQTSTTPDLDPCPYPAYIYDLPSDWSFVFRLFDGGAFAKHRAHVVVPPPRLQFTNDGKIIGTVFPSIAVEAIPIFRSVNIIGEMAVNCTVDATMPVFDPSTGKLRDLIVNSITIGKLQLAREFTLSDEAKEGLFTLGYAVLTEVIDRFLPLLNTVIVEALKAAPAFLVPSIEHAPMENKTIDMMITQATIQGHAPSEYAGDSGNVARESFVYVGAGIAVNVRDM